MKTGVESIGHRLSRLLAALLLVALPACAQPRQEGAQQGAIVFGFVGVLSGPVALNGELSSRGATLAVEQINTAGGAVVGGARHQVRLVLEDDQGAPGAGVNAVNKLLLEDKAAAVLGPEFSNVVLPTLAITDQHKVIQFHSTNSSIGQGQARPFAFRSRVEDVYLARAVVDYIAGDLGGKEHKVGISLINNEYGRTGSAALAKGLEERGVPVVTQVSHNFGDQDLTPNAAAMLSAGADVVVTWTGPAESIQLLRTLKSLGWRGSFIHGNPDSIFVSIGKEDVEGTVGPQGWVPTDPRPKSQEFVAAYRQRFKQEPDNHSAAYYDAVYLLKAAMEAVGMDPTRIRDYIAAQKRWEGVQGTYHPADLSGGSLITSALLVQVKDGQLKILRRLD
jgi:branched-chain amino acid transport system substrate-binding protein